MAVLKRAADWLEYVIAPVFSWMMIAVLVICIFLNRIQFGGKAHTIDYLPPVLLILVGLIFLTGIRRIVSLVISNASDWRRVVIPMALLLFIVQVVAVSHYFFRTGWDASLVREVSARVAHGEDISMFADYFSMYPNNLFLVFLYSGVKRIADVMGLAAYEDMAVVVVQCFLNTLSGILMTSVVYEFTKNGKTAVSAFLIFAMLIGMSPWVVVEYSDSAGLIFPVLILYLYVHRAAFKSEVPAWLLIGVCCGFGYKIKPQTLIIGIAIAGIEFLGLIKEKERFRRALSLLVMVSGLGISLLFSGLLCNSIDIDLNPESSYGMKHFLMMGLNEKEMGRYSGEDVAFSGQFSTKAERDAADMAVAVSRVKDMGVSGLSKLMVRKTLTNYYNGTFAWSGEGNFFMDVPAGHDDSISRFFRGLYYTDEYQDIGKYYVLWKNFEQMIWLCVLVLCAAESLLADKTDRRDRVMLLAIIGLTLFELLFEARARYLYTYAPLFVIVAVLGWQKLTEKDIWIMRKKVANNVE